MKDSKSSYRINYFEQEDNFAKWCMYNSQYRVKSQHRSLYYYLLHRNNKLLWTEWFYINYEDTLAATGIGSKHTYYKTLNELAEWGLILYQKGINDNVMAKISIVKLDEKTMNLPVHFCTSTSTAAAPQLAPLLAPLLHPLYITYNSITNNSITAKEKISVSEFISKMVEDKIEEIIVVRSSTELNDILGQLSTENTLPPEKPATPPPGNSNEELPVNATCEEVYDKIFSPMMKELETERDKYPNHKKDTLAALKAYELLRVQSRNYNYSTELFADWRNALVDIQKQFRTDNNEILSVIHYYLENETYAEGKIITLKNLKSHFNNIRTEMQKQYA